MKTAIGFAGTPQSVVDYTHSFLLEIMESPLYRDNPKISFWEYWRATTKSEREKVEESLSLGFETYKEFEDHNGDMNVGKSELMEIWNEWANSEKEPAYWPSNPEGA